MAAVLVRLRVELQRRLLSWLGVAVVAGLAGGIVTGLLAGAVRTTEAYPRFAEQMHAADVLVGGSSPFVLPEGRFAGAVELDEVEGLPQVGRGARASAILLFTGRTDTDRRVGPADMLPIAPADGRLGSSIERFRIVEGRRADAGRLDEATASFVLADRLGLRVGSTVELRFVRASGFESAAFQLLSNFGSRLSGDPGAGRTSIDALADGPRVRFRIVGIEASPMEFPPLGPDLPPALHLSEEFTRVYAHQLVATPLMYVHLKDPSLLDAFAKGLERLASGAPVGLISSRALHEPKVVTASQGHAIALTVAALLLLLAALVVVAQGLVRQAYADARDDAILSALGMSRTELYALAACRGLAIGAVAAVVAVVVSVAVSALMPIGIARTAELGGRVDLDPVALVGGALGAVVLVVLLRVAASWRVGRDSGRAAVATRRVPHVARALRQAPLPPAAEAGVRFALDPGSGARSVPVWASVVGVTLTLALLAGLWSFDAGLRHLLDTPRLYGWNWSARSGTPALPDLSEALVPAFEQDPTVVALASGTVTQAELGLQRVDVMALRQDLGRTVAPTVLEGRLPRQPGEAMLGTATLRDAGARVGDIAVLRLGNVATGLRVVGRGVFHEFGDTGRLGHGVFLTYEGLRRIQPEAQRNLFFVRFRGDVDVARNVRHLRRALDPVPTYETGRPRELQELAGVAGLSTVLAGLLALLAAATLLHTLLTSVHRRRRELAVLTALGFVRRQLRLTLVWETSALVVLALLVGLPLGVLVGRFAWNVFASNLGAVPAARIPWVRLLLTVPAVLLAANAIAMIPAWLATRGTAAEALRSE